MSIKVQQIAIMNLTQNDVTGYLNTMVGMIMYIKFWISDTAIQGISWMYIIVSRYFSHIVTLKFHYHPALLTSNDGK